MNNVTSRKRPYNPNAVRRRVIQETVTADGQALYRTKSFTRPGDKITWHPTVDKVTGECLCDCPDFRFKKKHAHINQPETWCKHLERAIGDLERKHEIAPRKARLGSEAADREIEWQQLLERAEAEAAVETPVPPHVDPATGEIREGWFEVVTPVLGFVKGQWITRAMVDEARAARSQGQSFAWDFGLG